LRSGKRIGVYKAIAIHQVGRFRLLILLASSQTTVEARVDSGVIEIVDRDDVVRLTLLDPDDPTCLSGFVVNS
jgi:hypothetical protein